MPRRKKAPPNEEHGLQLALALSESLAIEKERQRQDRLSLEVQLNTNTNIKPQDAYSILMSPTKTKPTKVSRKKQAKCPPPVTLHISHDELKNKYGRKLNDIFEHFVFDDEFLVCPEFLPSKLSLSRKDSNCNLWPHCETDFNRNYYVHRLKPQVEEVQQTIHERYQKIDQAKQLNDTSINDLETSVRKSSLNESILPSTQTAAVLAELAKDTTLNYTLLDQTVFGRNNTVAGTPTSNIADQTGFCVEGPVNIADQTGFCVEEPNRHAQESAKEELLFNLKQMVNNKTASDLELHLKDGKTVFCHRFILHSRCPKLVELTNGKSVISLTQFSFDSMLQVLQYLYYADIDIPNDLVRQVNRVANFLQLNDLAKICDTVIEENSFISPEDENVDTIAPSDNTLMNNLLKHVWGSDSDDSESSDSDKESADTDGDDPTQDHENNSPSGSCYKVVEDNDLHKDSLEDYNQWEFGAEASIINFDQKSPGKFDSNSPAKDQEVNVEKCGNNLENINGTPEQSGGNNQSKVEEYISSNVDNPEKVEVSNNNELENINNICDMNSDFESEFEQSNNSEQDRLNSVVLDDLSVQGESVSDFPNDHDVDSDNKKTITDAHMKSVAPEPVNMNADVENDHIDKDEMLCEDAIIKELDNDFTSAESKSDKQVGSKDMIFEDEIYQEFDNSWNSNAGSVAVDHTNQQQSDSVEIIPCNHKNNYNASREDNESCPREVHLGSDKFRNAECKLKTSTNDEYLEGHIEKSEQESAITSDVEIISDLTEAPSQQNIDKMSFQDDFTNESTSDLFDSNVLDDSRISTPVEGELQVSIINRPTTPSNNLNSTGFLNENNDGKQPDNVVDIDSDSGSEIIELQTPKRPEIKRKYQRSPSASPELSTKRVRPGTPSDDGINSLPGSNPQFLPEDDGIAFSDDDLHLERNSNSISINEVDNACSSPCIATCGKDENDVKGDVGNEEELTNNNESNNASALSGPNDVNVWDDFDDGAMCDISLVKEENTDPPCPLKISQVFSMQTPIGDPDNKFSDKEKNLNPPITPINKHLTSVQYESPMYDPPTDVSMNADTTPNFKTITPAAVPAKNKKPLSAWVPPSPYTPLPDYTTMNTPGLKKQCQKYGVRPLPKKKMVALLENIHTETHQYETDSDIEQDAIARRQAAMLVSPEKGGSSSPEKGKRAKKKKSKAQSSPNLSKRKQVKKAKVKKSKVIETEVSESTSSRVSEILNSSDGNDASLSENSESRLSSPSATQKIKKTDVVYKRQQMWNYIKNNTNLYLKILHYEPIEIDEFQKSLKETGVNCGENVVRDFLDDKCVQYTLRNKREEINNKRAAKKAARGKKSGRTLSQRSETT